MNGHAESSGVFVRALNKEQVVQNVDGGDDLKHVQCVIDSLPPSLSDQERKEEK